jgi:phosphoenolpyruvate carboxykinase (GTP)
MGRKLDNPPAIFRVNWVRRDEDNKFMWPGFGQNIRVLKWIVDRVNGKGFAVESPIGMMPRYEDIPWNGLGYPKEDFQELMQVERGQGTEEVRQHDELFDRFLDRLPKEMIFERESLRARLGRSPATWVPAKG